MPESSCCSPSRDSDASLSSSDQSLRGNTDEIELIEINQTAFKMGSSSTHVFHADGESPVRDVRVNPFLISTTTVTNRQFEQFVKATGYETDAEKFGWSFVFEGLVPDVDLEISVRGRLAHPNWWLAVNGANWRAPFGPSSTIADHLDHPVVQVSWNDAVAFAGWAGLRLPSEAEWEIAARGGLEQKIYPWGDDFDHENPPANIWQGNFPDQNLLLDGYLATAPAKSFEPNNFGLYNCVGNVWEWTSDSWQGRPDHKVTKGGSYLCHDSYCNRYRVSARTSTSTDSTLCHTGFRVAGDI